MFCYAYCHKGRHDWTPSFYTSRSIVNLSGLSVSDPTQPIAKQEQRQPSIRKDDSPVLIGASGGLKDWCEISGNDSGSASVVSTSGLREVNYHDV